MRVSSLGVARPAYYDRNAVGTRQRYVGTVGPHGGTSRWSATIAAGKKAFVEQMAIRIVAVTTATTAGYALAYMDLYDATNSTTGAWAQITTSTTALPYTFFASPTIPTLYAGETITVTSSDSSTGGTVFYVLDAKYTTFDA